MWSAGPNDCVLCWLLLATVLGEPEAHPAVAGGQALPGAARLPGTPIPIRPPAPLAPQVRAIPIDRLLLESDSPDGALDPPAAWLEALPCLAALREEVGAAGLRPLNRPCALRWTLRLVAAALGRAEEEVAAVTRANARRVFVDSLRGGDTDGGSRDAPG